MNYTIKPIVCDYSISRKAVLDCLKATKLKHSKKFDLIIEIRNEVMMLPPASSQPKTGHWIENYAEDGCGELYSHWICSECGRSVGFNYADIEDVLSEYPYCHCGAKMESGG